MARTNQNLAASLGTPYDINALNKLATKYGVKPLTLEQYQQLGYKGTLDYLKTGHKADMNAAKVMKEVSKIFKSNAKAVASENLKQAQLVHGTIRQGLAELGGLGAQIAAQVGGRNIVKAVSQNTNGGTRKENDDEEDSDLDDGIDSKLINSTVRYSFNGRKEE